jgi:glyoxylase-like metal-dependent hydrolase (beta-lactamase superfamily II)
LIEIDRFFILFYSTSLDLLAIHTPGHCPGSMCYLYTGQDGMRYLFSGDTIFFNQQNEWDIALKFHPYSGNKQDLIKSLQKLAHIPFDVLIPSIYTGTISFEKVSNEQRLKKVSYMNDAIFGENSILSRCT